MTQLRRDAAYIRKDAPGENANKLSAFDERVYEVLSTPHTVTSAAKALSEQARSESDAESRVADSMFRLLQAERIELSPDS